MTLISLEETARESRRENVRMEVHVEASRVTEELSKRRGMTRKVSGADENPLLPKLEVPVDQIQIDTDGGV
jgi:hypothetical protein